MNNTATVITMSRTVLDSIESELARAAVYNRNDQIAPAVVLWTDKERQWESLAAALRIRLPHFLTLGPYDPSAKTGPAIWLRCLLGRALPEADWSESAVPVLYLPGVSRQDLRAVEDCPRHLQPLAELQYRGVFWSQKNAKDWTISAFLQSHDGGLGLDVARDQATIEAARRSLARLAGTTIAELAGRRLEAADFLALFAPDSVKTLLAWLNDPAGTRRCWDENDWTSFREVCRSKYGFDPQTDGELVGGEKLGSREGAWTAVWERFAEAPEVYSGLPALLERAKPPKFESLLFERECWPQFNREMEESLRVALREVGQLASTPAAAKILELDNEHGRRRAWVWSRLHQAPLAIALGHLATVATVTQKPLTGADADSMAQAYMTTGWQADAAAIDAMAAVRTAADAEAIREALQAVYRPWLEAAAERFQHLAREVGYRGRSRQQVTVAENGCCLLFVDGLRFDVGKRLAQALEQCGVLIEAGHAWVAAPPVTPTAKPAASPVADLLGGGEEGVAAEFCPWVVSQKKQLTVDRFRKLLAEREIQFLGAHETGNPAGKAWTEYGQIDRRGHDEQWRLAYRIGEEVRGLVDRIETLFDAGWKKLRIITDHGWLLLPGGLPKEEMPSYLVETRWGRCAVLKPKSSTTLPTGPWYWDEHVTIAFAPGIKCFKAGMDYAHGSLTLQECLVPEFVIQRPAASGSSATIELIKWVGLRCRVTVSGEASGLKADLRTKPADSSTTVVGGPKEFGAEKTASLPVLDDRLEGAVIVVLLDRDGQVIAKRSTIVGGEE